MCPVGSVFLLRAAPDVAQQSNPSMAVSATIVERKVDYNILFDIITGIFPFLKKPLREHCPR